MSIWTELDYRRGFESGRAQGKLDTLTALGVEAARLLQAAEQGLAEGKLREAQKAVDGAIALRAFIDRATAEIERRDEPKEQA